MKRRALLIYCNNTFSGPLSGPEKDYENFKAFLQSRIGGEWHENEILGLDNPTVEEVHHAMNTFMSNADYTFTLFSGHGCVDENIHQYMEVADGNIRVKDVKTNAPRKTLIIDACRGLEISTEIEAENRFFSKANESISGIGPTRALFEQMVRKCDEGLSILYSASPDESSDDSENGGIYLLSLLKVAESWRDDDTHNTVLTIKDAHTSAIEFLQDHFEESAQRPRMKPEKRNNYFPFAVKHIPLHS